MSNHKSVLLDTGFCIRLLDETSNYHENAKDYYKYFLDNSIPMYLSTIVVAEYTVKDDVSNLPLDKFRLIPFDLKDGTQAGKFFDHLRKRNQNWQIEGLNRVSVKDDCKLIAQAYKRNIEAFVTADDKAERKIINPLKQEFGFGLDIINIKYPLKNYTGELF